MCIRLKHIDVTTALSLVTAGSLVRAGDEVRLSLYIPANPVSDMLLALGEKLR
jgi:hypothetical protein